ncbi:DUF3379 domain-containing protein [Flavicella sediminum]|uniref:DUF3379 domain-containing protein n=1 Tax=Flavicella sediminum TaxID=2585141 RepID=UPI00112391D5|nr:DUF3379 domain-containing protein [Flavicella sediminum]
METNNTDTVFKEAFKNRKLQPSSSSWNRLSAQLDEHQETKKKKRVWVFLSYAASFLFILGLSIYYSQQSTTTPVYNLEEQLVGNDKTTAAPIVHPKVETLIIVEEPTTSYLKETSIAFNNKKKQKITKQTIIPLKVENKSDVKTAIASSIAATEPKELAATKTSHRKIKIDPNLLLEAIALENEALLNKTEKRNLIEKELLKRNLNLDPIALLQEIEKDIDNSSFKEKFMKSLKVNIEHFATAFNERNK